MRKFKSGDFDAQDREHSGGPKKWDQAGVMYYELFKPGETINIDRYIQQMINFNFALTEKRPQWAPRHGKVILQYFNELSKALWTLPRPTINFSIFVIFEDVKNGSINGFAERTNSSLGWHKNCQNDGQDV